MVVRNDLDRYHLVEDVDRPAPAARRARGLREAGAPRTADRAPEYISTYGDDMTEINDWSWESGADAVPASDAAARTSAASCSS